jgi:hypothetical protein
MNERTTPDWLPEYDTSSPKDKHRLENIISSYETGNSLSDEDLEYAYKYLEEVMKVMNEGVAYLPRFKLFVNHLRYCRDIFGNLICLRKIK